MEKDLDFKHIESVLTIDGNYFGHRAIHGMRKDNNAFTLDTQHQMLQFEHELFREMMGLYNSFGTIIDLIVFVKDCNSWRKTIEPHKPYYIKDDTKIGYKENREEKKAEDNVNWENFNLCLENFLASINDIVPVFDVDGFEGDDALLLLTEFFASKGILSILFATDGDLEQLVQNRHVMYYKNTRSKEQPNGTIIIHDDYLKFLKRDVAQQFMNPETSLDLRIKRLFKLKVGDGEILSRSIANGGVIIAEPNKAGFTKVIEGDKKDNLFPLYRWKSGGAGTKNMKVTERMVIKVCKLHLGGYVDSTVHQIMTDDDTLATLLINLRSDTKQEGIAKDVMKHFKHNYRMNVLKTSNIPEKYINNFNQKLALNYELLKLPANIDQIRSRYIKADKADVIKASVPESTELVNDILSPSISVEPKPQPSTQPKTDNQSLVDNILNM